MVDDELIYKYFFGNFVICKKYRSPLRPDDKDPSFCLIL